MALGKYIPVISEKIRKCLADCQAGEGIDLCYLVMLGVVKNYLFKPFNGLCHHPVFFHIHGLKVVVHLHCSYVAFMFSYLIST